MTDWNNKEEVLAAVEMDGESLQWASEELKADREVVLVAIEECGWALEFACE